MKTIYTLETFNGQPLDTMFTSFEKLKEHLFDCVSSNLGEDVKVLSTKLSPCNSMVEFVYIPKGSDMKKTDYLYTKIHTVEVLF